MARPERISYPRQHARTRNFTLGRSRAFHVSREGSRVVFLRSPAGDDPRTSLWVFDVASRKERLIADAAALLAGEEEDVPYEERARRERVREGASGIVAFAVDREARVASFALGRRVFVADLVNGGARDVPTTGRAVDPRVDPTGKRVAYVADGALRVIDDDGDRALPGDDDQDVTWGLAEFVAAEEMDRTRGFWWSPDGTRIVAARVDVAPVPLWHIADPTDPSREPVAVRYPAAGTNNAIVSLSIVALDGSRVDVGWDMDAFPYLARVVWRERGPLTLLVQSRDQRTARILAVDDGTGVVETLHEEQSAAWLDIVDGSPAWLDDGALARAVHDDAADRRRIAIEDHLVTPADLDVRSLVHAGRDAIVFTATRDDPTAVEVWRRSTDGDLTRLGTADGVHAAASNGHVTVLVSTSMDRVGAMTTVVQGAEVVGEIASHAEAPVIAPNVSLVTLGDRELRSALLLPRDAQDDARLPVLLDPYGGPHAQRVLRAQGAFLVSQWLADQGFAVLVADGRGTPGRGLRWERAVRRDLATPALEDQVEALHAAAELEPRLDLSRVAIRGWSFGGYLAALAVLRRPDVFHAAVAGAPVTDWRLYDTHYTERYLGHPGDDPESYERSSILKDAANLERPLLLIHGLADDNVVVAHTLRLSQRLMEAGRPHSLLPLSGVTHMTPQEIVAENLLLLQVAFLKQALGLAQSPP